MLKIAQLFCQISLIIYQDRVFIPLSTLWYFSSGLPDYKKLSNYQPPISTRVYSDGW